MEAPETTEKYTNIQVDSQLLSAFMKCERYFKYRYIRNLEPIQESKGALLKGTLVHHGLAIFYNNIKLGIDKITSEKLAIKGMREMAPTLTLDADDIIECYRATEEYFEYRRNDNFIVHGVEVPFRFLAHTIEELKLRIILTGRIDLITKDFKDNTLLPWDHKTASQDTKHSNMSNQFMIYALACKSHNVIVNPIGFQKTVAAEKKFKRQPMSYSDSRLSEFRDEVLPQWIQRFLLASATDNYIPNYYSCDGKYACEFSDKNGEICSIDKPFRESKIARFYKVGEGWDPTKL